MSAYHETNHIRHVIDRQGGRLGDHTPVQDLLTITNSADSVHE